jgi:O-antigen/teichoic acid export membrane protein
MKTPLDISTPHESFSRNVATLMSGTAMAFVINLAALPVLSRLYGPEDFGLLSIFAGIVTVIAVLATGRYELAIVLPESREEARALLKLSVYVLAVITALSLLAALAVGDILLQYVNLSQMEPWLVFLPAGILVTGLYSIFFYWSSRRKAFRLMAAARLSQTAVMVLFQMAAAFFWSWDAAGLILGYLVGQIPGIVILCYWRGDTPASPSASPSIRGVAARYGDFPRLSSLGALLETLALQLPVIAISAIFSPYAGGLYAVTDRLLRSVPTGLVGKPLAEVFYRRVTELRAEPEKGKALIYRIWRNLLLLILPPLILILLIGPDLFAVALGAEWRQAGEFARVLAIGFAAQFIALPSGMGLIALERLGILLGWQILNFLSLVIVLVVGFLYFRDDVMTFLWIWTCKEVAMQSLCMAALLRAHEASARKSGANVPVSPGR